MKTLHKLMAAIAIVMVVSGGIRAAEKKVNMPNDGLDTSAMNTPYHNELPGRMQYLEDAKSAIKNLAKKVYRSDAGALRQAQDLKAELEALVEWYDQNKEDKAQSVRLAANYKITREDAQELIFLVTPVVTPRHEREPYQRHMFLNMVREAEEADANEAMLAALRADINAVTGFIDAFRLLRVEDEVQVYVDSDGKIIGVEYEDATLGVYKGIVEKVTRDENGKGYQLRFVRSTRQDAPRQKVWVNVLPDAKLNSDESGTFVVGSVIKVKNLDPIQPEEYRRNPLGMAMEASKTANDAKAQANQNAAGLSDAVDALGSVTAVVENVSQVAEDAHKRIDGAKVKVEGHTWDKDLIQGGAWNAKRRFRDTGSKIQFPERSSN